MEHIQRNDDGSISSYAKKRSSVENYYHIGLEVRSDLKGDPSGNPVALLRMLLPRFREGLMAMLKQSRNGSTPKTLRAKRGQVQIGNRIFWQLDTSSFIDNQNIKWGIAHMPTGGGRKRTNMESKAFKSKIIELRAQNKSIVKIAKQMKVSKQYVSLVLIEAGQGVGAELREKRRAVINDGRRAKEDEVENDISRLEQRGEYSLANWLRFVAQRRKG